MCSDKSQQVDSFIPEVADIFREFKKLLPYADDDEWKVINSVTSCRTQKLGGHKWRCSNCDYTEISYNSCRNRHCPKCQNLDKARWILKRDSELLPVPYFHLVFTIPSVFKALIPLNKRVFYTLLFKASSQTLKEVLANPDNLGASCGFFSILHTWDQKLNIHPHIHSVVPGGGLSKDKTGWTASRKNFLVSVRKLSRVFRGKFLDLFKQLYLDGLLVFEGESSCFEDQQNFDALLASSCKTDWVVYAKPPFKGAFWVLRYLARYTHRIAISNSRIISMDDEMVQILWRDRKHGYAKKILSLDAVTFMRRFLNHVLPSGFVRIRYYGFMGNTVRKDNVLLIRHLLGCDDFKAEPVPTGWVETMIRLTGKDPLICRCCGKGRMVDLNPFSYGKTRAG